MKLLLRESNKVYAWTSHCQGAALAMISIYHVVFLLPLVLWPLMSLGSFNICSLPSCYWLFRSGGRIGSGSTDATRQLFVSTASTSRSTSPRPSVRTGCHTSLVALQLHMSLSPALLLVTLLPTTDLFLQASGLIWKSFETRRNGNYRERSGPLAIVAIKETGRSSLLLMQRIGNIPMEWNVWGLGIKPSIGAFDAGRRCMVLIDTVDTSITLSSEQ